MNQLTPGAAVSTSVGARVTPGGVTYRVWAPHESELAVLVERNGRQVSLPLACEENGYWSGFDSNGRAGDLYRFALSASRHRPDPASRFQPQGVHGPSECVDPSTFRWQCTAWSRPAWIGQTIYEIHVGTLTAAGTYRAAIEVLDNIRDLGAEAIELMPVADFAGDRNWGYDGVALYAPARCYGRPDDLRALVDAAHERGLAVILDVVYNHLGPAGNYLADYSPAYFRHDHHTPWGQGFAVDEPGSQPVRDFLIENVAYWLDEFRFDGLRLDATHAIPDRSHRHVLTEIAEVAHARGAFLIAEDERNHAGIISSPQGESLGLDAVWADDFHHQVRVALTGVKTAYFRGYSGSTADLASTLSHGWSYRGQSFAPWEGRPRGTDCDYLPTKAFVICIENHDQVGNRAKGERLEHLVTPRQFRAASLLLCLSPYAPMIFMGQEWAASTPFLFFTDHGGELGRQISVGRRREFEQHGTHWGEGDYPDPETPATFEHSKLKWKERENPAHAGTLALYHEALRQRRAWLRDLAITRENWRVEATGDFLAIRYQTEAGDRLLLVSLGENGFPESFSSTVLAPPPGREWEPVLHSEEIRFGGQVDLAGPGDWRTGGPCAVWLDAVKEGSHHASA